MTNQTKTVLCIEDDLAIRRLIAFKFTNAGYRVIAAQDGEEGLKLAQTEKPQIILLDLVLPKINGFEVLHLLKQDEKTKHIPVIIFSNLSQETDKERVTQLGAAAFLVKSEFSIKEVLDIAQKFLL